jgi:hypothetical protein
MVGELIVLEEHGRFNPKTLRDASDIVDGNVALNQQKAAG